MTMTDISSVKNALALLRVAVDIGSPQIVSTCVAYLEAAPWEKSEEKEILRILPKIGQQAELALTRLQPVSALAVANIFLSAIRLATSSPSSLTNDLKSSAQEQLEYMLTEDDGAPLLTVDDGIKLETSRCVDGFLARFVNLVNSFLVTGDKNDKNEAIVGKGKSELLLAYLSDLSWVFQIVTKFDISSDFVRMWVETSVSVVRVAESAFPGVQLKVVDVTSKVLQTIGSGLVVLPAVKRLGMVKIWLPFVRNVKSLVDLIASDEDNDMMIKPDAEMWQSLESAFVSIILTLPSSDQAEILTEWLEDKQICYPNLTEAFEVWCHRSKAAMRRLALLDGTNQATNKMRLKREDEANENKRSYKAQPHLYTNIKIARDEDLKEQIGNDIYFDLVDHEKVCSFLIEKQMTFNLFKEEVAEEFGIPVQYQRFWIWAERHNNTYRPLRPLTQHEEALPVGALRDVSKKARNGELNLFLDVKRGQASPEKNKEDKLLFFKLYDPIEEDLRYVGRLFLKSSCKPIEILTKLNELAGFAPDQEIELFEEVRSEPTVMCDLLYPNDTFSCSQIDDGDIICFQKKRPPESNEQTRFPEVPLFLEYVKNRQNVHFRASENPEEDEFCLELAKYHTYDDVVERVAQHLRLDDPSKIRLTHNCYSQQLEPNPIKYRPVNQISDTLYYEVLDIETLKVAFHHATKDEAIILDIRLPKPSTVGDVLNEIKTKVELSHPDAELRLLEVFYHKIYKIFPLQEKIENINDQYWTLRAEEIPEEEKNLSPNDRLIHVYHFTKESAQDQVQVHNFGEPFFLVIHECETLAEVKARIQMKLQVADEEFSKWKFAFFSLGHPEYLEDFVVVSTRFQRRDVYCVWEQHLGLEHSDTTPERAFSASQNRHTFEKPVKYTTNPIYFFAANEKGLVFDYE